MLKELKAFLLRGDVMSLAIAVIIAGAFQKIVDSLVADVVMPIVGLFTGNPDFSEQFIFAGVKFGSFLQAIINFILIGIVLFMLVKAAGKKTDEIG